MERCLYCMHFKHEVHGELDLCLECIKKLYSEVIRLTFQGFGETVNMAIAKALPQVEAYILSEMR